MRMILCLLAPLVIVLSITEASYSDNDPKGEMQQISPSQILATKIQIFEIFLAIFKVEKVLKIFIFKLKLLVIYHRDAHNFSATF